MSDFLKVQVAIKATMDKVWNGFTQAQEIEKWYFASADWKCSNAKVNLVEGGEFSWKMEAKDGSKGFVYKGRFDEVLPHARIAYHLEDQRKVICLFSQEKESILVTQEFQPSGVFSNEDEIKGWQGILDNFKAYLESKS